MSTSPLVLHFVRPYASAEEYLRAEAWTIDARSILLIGAEELPPETLLLFDVALESGEKLIRAEGKVVGAIAAENGRPGGLRIKYRRYGATTKAFIDRAVRHDREVAPEPVAPEPARPPAASLPEIVAPSVAAPLTSDGGAVLAARSAVRASEVEAPPAALSSVRASERAPAPAVLVASATPSDGAPPSASATPSGVHRRPFSPEDVPPNRDALLARLRERARGLDAEGLLAERKSAS